MVESVALEPRVRLPHNGRRFLDYVSSPLAYLSRVVSSIRGREVGIYPNDSAPPIPISEQTHGTSIEQNQGPELQAILKDPAWKGTLTTNQREALVINSLVRLSYYSICELYNPKYSICELYNPKGRHAIFYRSALIASIDVVNGTYTPADGSLPSDMEAVLNKADFKLIVTKP